MASLLNLPPISLPIPSLQVDTEPLFEFPEPYSKFWLVIHFTYGNISFLVTHSIHLTLSSPLPMSIGLFSMSVSPLKTLSRVRLFVTPWTIAHQAPLSMEFSRQEYWSGLPFSSPGDLPEPGIEPGLSH